jgi:outer membrane lipoprotein-sorting protein
VDLNQVTVKKLEAALGSNPAALLSGSNEIERGFELKDDGKSEGVEWLQAIPKAQDAGFDKIRMGFDARAELVAMELNDAFGHKTVLRFTNMRHNPKFSAQQFRFVPPKGADVVGE